jgi:hypothetical protein
MAKNWTTTFALRPIVPSIVPNMREKKIIPKVLVPGLKRIHEDVGHWLLYEPLSTPEFERKVIEQTRTH